MHRWTSVDDVRFRRKPPPPLPPQSPPPLSYRSINSNNNNQNSAALYINVATPFYLNKDNDHLGNSISSQSTDKRTTSFNNGDRYQYSTSTHAQNDKPLSSSRDYYVTTLPTKTNTTAVQLPSYSTTYTFSLNQPLRSSQSLTSLTSIESPSTSLSFNDKNLADIIEEPSSSSKDNITDNDVSDKTKVRSYKTALNLPQPRVADIVNLFEKGSVSNMSSSIIKFQKPTNTRIASPRCSTSSTSSMENGGSCLSPPSSSPTNGSVRTNHLTHKNSVFSKLWERRNDVSQKKQSIPTSSVPSTSFNFPNNGPIVVVEKANSQIQKSSPIIVYERISSENNQTTFRTNHDRNENNLKRPLKQTTNNNIYRTELIPKLFTPVTLNIIPTPSTNTFTKTLDQSNVLVNDDDSAIQLSPIIITHATSEDSLLAGSENTLSILSRSSTTATTTDSSNSDNQDTSSSIGSCESKNIFKSNIPTKNPSFARPTISSMQKTRNTTDQHSSFTKPDENNSIPVTFQRRKSLENLSTLDIPSSATSPTTIKSSTTFQRQTLGRGSLRVSSTSSKPHESIIPKSTPVVISSKKEPVYSEFKKFSDTKAISCENLSKETKISFNGLRNEQQPHRTKLWTVDEDNLDENISSFKPLPVVETPVVNNNSVNDDKRLSPSPTIAINSSYIEEKNTISSATNNGTMLKRGRFMSEANLLDQYRRFSSEDAIRSDSTLFNPNKPLKYKQDSLIKLYGWVITNTQYNTICFTHTYKTNISISFSK
ncbi:unnamed protein product [Didymodactylos carnosus]|uniref:Uncharacterized protein n=1 Tax=Didymodactylos carnosus TaxID=1234261 RepID=A0A8S2ICA2_9BILA|nr:unnamed protein product [Didymodactylos carnosus]CAF3742158.1 unnamed protein product [Didymodactylos carnosus]